MRGWSKTPLMKAAREGHLDVMEILVKHGADVNGVDKNTDQTALMMAIKGGDEECIHYLLDNAADINALNTSHYIPRTALLIHLQSFFESDDWPDTKDTTWYFAKQIRILDLLISQGADVNLCYMNEEYCDSETKVTPLAKAARIDNEQGPSVVHKLLQARAKINCQMHCGYASTALSVAVVECNSRMVKVLIQNGADTSIIPDNMESGFVSYAVKHNDFITAKYLVQSGSSLEKEVVHLIIDAHVLLQTATESDTIKVLKDKENKESLIWLYNYVHEPASLKYLCRTSLRIKTHIYKSDQLESVPLPELLKKFVLCKDIF